MDEGNYRITDEKRYQQLVFSSDYCGGEEKLWETVSTQLKILLTNGYIAVVREDEVGIVEIQYEHDETHDAWGVANPEWITEDELWIINNSKEDEIEND